MKKLILIGTILISASLWGEIELGLECNTAGTLNGTTWHRIDIKNKEVLWSGSDSKWDRETNKLTNNLEEETLKITEITDKTITYKGKRRPYTIRKTYKINRYSETDTITGRDLWRDESMTCKSYSDQLLTKRRDLFFLQRETQKKF
tara:strand:+ start:324 stop:764 length:441 start_codon:yes stop_codon:yes gene_type:complete